CARVDCSGGVCYFDYW
nr:immunoglobulin heavy chain junction region [Macaca mulatta]MOX65055.1 immunoglobulin heavy chain junction region [Macaca mulatta]MOX65393.1 immunoglobulin heavy chain junction region [Macaca mulatta]MOX65475.1 immunoglobulin heavy chain junction region [Macaca mulatta]MOX65916.1 immunoglobulin heavy chain junction region [Macaca mulatta]